MIDNLKESLETKIEEESVATSFWKIAESICKANNSEKVLTASKQMGSASEHNAYIISIQMKDIITWMKQMEEVQA